MTTEQRAHLRTIDPTFVELSDMQNATRDALEIAIEHLTIMGEWNEPYATEAKTALDRISKTLSKVTKK